MMNLVFHRKKFFCMIDNVHNFTLHVKVPTSYININILNFFLYFKCLSVKLSRFFCKFAVIFLWKNNIHMTRSHY